MSDHKYGEPVEDSTAPGETTSADEAVARAHEGLADAEAASRDVVEGDDVARHDAAPHTETYAAEPAVADAPTVVAPVAGSLYADDPVVFKKLVYEMRFDEASAWYGEFGPFYTGLQFSPDELPRYLDGAVPDLTKA